MSTLRSCLYLVLVSVILLGTAGISIAQVPPSGGGGVFQPSGCWDLSAEEVCSNESDSYNCIWRSGGFGDSWGRCERTTQRDCWQYNANSTCQEAICEWDSYGYCYKENCWDFKDQASCKQAYATSAGKINCKWETMNTADTSDDFCSEIGCWNYNTNTTCTDTGCMWGSQGGWCSNLGCWSFETETTCNTQGNCRWEGGSNCRFKSCWDFTTVEECTDSVAHPNMDCMWENNNKYCYELGCWDFNGQAACENESNGLTCVWDNINNNCHKPSCYDYSDQTNCEATTDDLSCFWDSAWKECHEVGCWNFNDQTNCEASSTPDCTWRVSGWCSEYDCWAYGTQSSCANSPAELGCSWHDEPHCEGDPSLNCWNYEEETGCTSAGCEWKPGWCSKPGCWDLNTDETCSSMSDCIWITKGADQFCEELGCWILNETTCEANGYGLTCIWDAQSKNCYKKGCWDYNNENDCTDMIAHPDSECLWDSGGNFCYEPGCWNYKDQSSCASNSCRWEIGGGFCEETRESTADCWNILNNVECSGNTECVWEIWGSCQDKQACWAQNTKTDCEALSSAKRCAWDSEHQNCYEKGCWDYKNQTGCTSAGCNWDGTSCFEEGCWKYNDQTNCLDLNDALSCKWETQDSCYEEGCWNFNDQTNCETNECSWQTGGWCEADNPGAACWEYWDPLSCDSAVDCSWTENSWCEEPGAWQYNNENDCRNANFSWKSEGGWCKEPFDTNCWEVNQTVCETKTSCRWDFKSNNCINRECWEYKNNESCLDTPEELGCEWFGQESSGWCEELGCWNFNEPAACGSNKTDMQCAWATFGWCEEKNCWMLENETGCLDVSDSLDCEWENAMNPDGGMCEPEFGGWDADCWQYNNEIGCNVVDGCKWRTGWCNKPGCWRYNETDCEDPVLHPNMDCSWRSDDFGGGWCEDLGCWNFMAQEDCDSHGGDMGCTWHFDQWNPGGGWCEEPGCWSYRDETSCSSADMKGTACVWHSDPGGFGGWCEMGGCGVYDDQSGCGEVPECTWRAESHCEKARCWMWDSTSGGDEATCAAKGAEYGLNCSWNNNWCEQSHAGCDAYNGDRQGCFDTMFCWWDEFTQTCNSPGDAGGGEWLAELEGDRMNPGCWIFDHESDYCSEDYVDVCRWNNATEKCNGLSSDVEIKCSNIKDSGLCESIPILSTCCEWKNNKCQAAPENTKCYMNMEKPPEGAMFCEDYVAYTDETTCERIAGEPWFMPCDWDGTHCVFRSDDKFGGEKKGCDAMTNKKDCEFAGCEWDTDFYCEGTAAVPFGRCEEKTGFGAKSCDAACWACEYKPDGSVWSSALEARNACEGSDLGYCAWISDATAPNGFGFCEMPEDVKYMGDCSSDCKACEKKNDPESACQSSSADCKWVEDTSGETTIGGWCYPRSEKSCAEDCFRCYDEVSCVNYGGGSKGTCIWGSDTKICKPKNFDKEICFNGVDDDGDSRVDCEDSDCFSDPFCGAGMMSDCGRYDTREKCISEGNTSNCIWIKDPWEGREWCGIQGENCFLWDGNEVGCGNQPMCDWFPDPAGGFCEVEDSKIQACFKATTQGACTINSDCYWGIDPTSPTGGSCEPKMFKCESKTSQADCTAGEWSSRCTWAIDSETGTGKCEPICFSKNLETDTTCNNNVNCEWMTGICDPAGQFEMNMGDCWRYDDDPTACGEKLGCGYHMEMGGGFCDINFTRNDEFCMDKRDQTSCVNAGDGNTCKWQEQGSMSFCDLKIFACGWYQDEGACNADAGNYGGCAWITEGVPHCEPICFNQETPESCGSEAPTCAWRQGFCEPKMAKMMFGGMEDKPVDLGGDEDGGCGPGSVDENIASELDICDFGMREMPDNYGFSAGVSSLENAALCKGKKIVKEGPVGSQDVTDSGMGTNTTKFYLYLDTDGSEEGNCWLWNDPDRGGYEFFFKYVVKMGEGEVEETKTAYRCKDGDWIITDIKLTGWKTLMCSEIGGLMIAVNKDDLRRFTDLFTVGGRMRVYVATAGQKRNESNPADTAGPGYYTPGAVDFKFEDCLTSGVDMDGDGFKSENDPDCFMFYKSGGFMKHEGCFETGIDEDNDGLVDCDDPDCKFAPNCVGRGAGLLNDSTAPKLVWKEVEKHPDGAFIRYDTDEPANGTIQFHYNDSSCKTLSKTIKDPALLDDKTRNDYKNWHDGPIDNFEFNPQRLGYDLVNGTTYYYKLKVCDPSSNCALSACLNFTTARSSGKRDCPACYAIVPGDVGSCGVATKKIGYNETTNIPLMFGNETAITIENVKGKSFDAPNITRDNVTTSGGGAGYVGMDSDDYDRMRSKLGAYTDINCTIKVPRGDGGDCDRLWHCPDPVNGVIDFGKCEDESGEGKLLSYTSDYCEWRVPCDFSVWMSNPGTSTGEDGDGGTGVTTGTGGGGGSGGGGTYNAKQKPSCFDGIENCHDGLCESGVDCGGPCNACPSCSDRIQNQGETGMDCGGPCNACTTTTTAVKTTAAKATTTTMTKTTPETTTAMEVATTSMPEVTTAPPGDSGIPISVQTLSIAVVALAGITVLVFILRKR